MSFSRAWEAPPTFHDVRVFRVPLVRAVDSHVQRVELVHVGQGDAEFARQIVALQRRGDAADVFEYIELVNAAPYLAEARQDVEIQPFGAHSLD